jgi:hypothetical protein
MAFLSDWVSKVKEEAMAKPNCYDCQYRGEVAGSAHSCCKHPDIPALSHLEEALGILGVAPPSTLRAMRDLGISAVPHGIRMGWFIWPVNFDPTWLTSCNCFLAVKAKGGE